jgi:hypothetical protein
MLQVGHSIIRVAGGCPVVRLKPINFDRPWVRWKTQEFARAYRAALRAGRDPGKDSDVLCLMRLITEGNGQPRLPGF